MNPLQIAIQAFQAENFESANSMLRVALQKDINAANAIFEVATHFAENGGVKNALVIFECLKTYIKNDAQIPYNLGCLYSMQSNYESAYENFYEALAISPKDIASLVNCASALHELKRFDEAISYFDIALSLESNYAQAWSNKGNSLYKLKRYDEAITNLDKALYLNPDDYKAWSNKALTLHELKRFDEAIIHHDKALSLKPDYAKAWTNKGITLSELKRHDEAIAHYDKALSLKPDYHETSWNKSLSLLLLGNFEKGLPLYESRWDLDEVSKIAGKRYFDKPTWLGVESLQGKTILIYGEQGLGDFIQFCRYVKLVSDLGAKVILETPKPLASLMENLEGVSQLVIKGQELPLFDYQCPLLSLPLALNVNIFTIPADVPYLISNPSKVDKWRLKLGEKKKKRVGIAWSSMSEFKDDHKRSLLLMDFVQALPLGEFEYICLQKEIKDCDKEFFENYKNIRFFGNELRDFSDTAALIENVDLVVSTCTSIPHLSGALGKETWILLSYVPDWRWLLDRVDSPWYPSIKLYRQPSIGDWGSVLGKVNFDLNHF
ncbi:tetratricopeptide repeat protein [Polynucleobacter sp. UK-Mo-2m-Kol15]|uniref:tetratricopeptide repeat-containing glycosyltransferase family protein n=1 Tax=Polynucleobacter sp. UK-Mo-2m-Kol15 TaxID=2576916 RepID=UPI001C0D6B8E|nr:tetratricopeptide repeat-containing glycosyltransferase family protein [Polynucleobacter sp. UK-Mo-2m-Kol15]MBU3576347.1 glycosyltransferase family protein [Polynucleobacter sp. UK-Mo-2m-Kol15]